MRQNLILGNNTFIAFQSLVIHVCLIHCPVLSGGDEDLKANGKNCINKLDVL